MSDRFKNKEDFLSVSFRLLFLSGGQVTSFTHSHTHAHSFSDKEGEESVKDFP